MVVRESFARAFAEELIDEFLEDEIVPDVLIDVLSVPDTELDVGSAQAQVEAWVYEDMVRSVVHGLAKTVALECTDDLVDQYFISKMKEARDPHEVFVEDLINDGLVGEAKAVVDEAIAELVAELLAESKIQEARNAVVDEALEEMLEDVVRRAIVEHGGDQVGEEMYQEDLGAFIRLIAEEEYAEAQGIHLASGQRLEFLQASDMAASKLLDELVIRHLLNTLGSGGDMALFDAYMDRTMSQLMARVLLVRQQAILSSAARTRENELLSLVHDALTTDMAIAFVVDRMKALVPSQASAQFAREAVAISARDSAPEARAARAALDRDARMSELKKWLARNDHHHWSGAGGGGGDVDGDELVIDASSAYVKDLVYAGFPVGGEGGRGDGGGGEEEEEYEYEYLEGGYDDEGLGGDLDIDAGAHDVVVPGGAAVSGGAALVGEADFEDHPVDHPAPDDGEPEYEYEYEYDDDLPPP